MRVAPEETAVLVVRGTYFRIEQKHVEGKDI